MSGGKRLGAGRPKKPPAAVQGGVVRVYLTTAELAELDRQRGETSRSAWLARPLRS